MACVIEGCDLRGISWACHCSGTVECNEPILIVSMKLGICKVDPQGKDCSTTFMRLSYNGRTSVVKCKVMGPIDGIHIDPGYLF